MTLFAYLYEINLCYIDKLHFMNEMIQGQAMATGIFKAKLSSYRQITGD